MKNCLITATVLTSLAGCAFAQTTVSSANIVGYIQTPTPDADAFEIISLTQFANGTNESINIQDAINIDSLYATNDWDSANKLIIWNSSNNAYNSYGLYQPEAGAPYWMVSGRQWLAPAYFPPSAADVEITRGQSVWFRSGSSDPSTNILVSGDVYLDDQYTMPLISSFSLISYPYSSSINLTNLIVSNATASASWDTADKVVIWDKEAKAYNTFGLYQPETGNSYWMISGRQWLAPAYFPPSASVREIDLGKGFWYRTEDYPKNISFEKIYSISE